MLKSVDPAPARIEFLQLSFCRCKNASSPTKAAVLDPVLEGFFYNYRSADASVDTSAVVPATRKSRKNSLTTTILVLLFHRIP